MENTSRERNPAPVVEKEIINNAIPEHSPSLEDDLSPGLDVERLPAVSIPDLDVMKDFLGEEKEGW